MEKSPVFDFEAYERRQYLGKTWQYVLEENEWFDGEKEIEAAAKERWRRINQQATKVRLPEVTRALRKGERRR